MFAEFAAAVSYYCPSLPRIFFLFVISPKEKQGYYGVYQYVGEGQEKCRIMHIDFVSLSPKHILSIFS